MTSSAHFIPESDKPDLGFPDSPANPGAHFDIWRLDVMSADAKACRTQTRRTMGASAVIHVLLLSWLVLYPHVAPSQTLITEITLLEPGELSSGGSAPAGPAPAGASGANHSSVQALATSHGPDTHFQRPAKRGLIAPTPQSRAAFSDRLEARLAAMQAEATAPVSGAMPATATPNAMWGTASIAGTGAGGSGGTAPIELNRGGAGPGGGGVGRGVALNRGRGQGSAPALAVPRLRDAGSEGSAPAAATGATARRNLAGMSLLGPIADRPISRYSSPTYPEWAKRDGVEGSVTLYFVVLADGRVKENIVVQKTAGFEDFDESARMALQTWQFEPLRPGRTGEQWGTITFHFRLRDSG
jgi:TonB family protein